jgi:hypothetical protein
VARRRSSSSGLARLAAPVAFLLAATIAILLVRSAIHEGENSAVRDRTTASETERGRTTPRQPRRRDRNGSGDRSERTFYRVSTGDTLQTIAAAHGTTVERLLELNPGIDPRTLTVGQQVRVR